MRHCLSVVLLTGLLAGNAYAFPIETVNVAALVDRADVVVVGRIVSLVDAGAAPNDPEARVFQGAIDVDTVIKGPQIAVVKFTRAQRIPTEPTPADECGLFFLRNGATEYEFASAYHPSVAGVCGMELPPGTDPLRQATTVLGAAARSRQLRPDLRRSAIRDLSTAEPTTAIASLRRVLLDPEPSVQRTAAAVLLRLGDLTPLPLAESTLLRPDVDRLGGEDVSNLRNAIRSVRQPRAIATLDHLLAAPDVEVRRAAAEALGQTESLRAADPLLRALDDADLEVRYFAVRGLAKVTGAPGWLVERDAFEADPERYVSHWREWAAARRDEDLPAEPAIATPAVTAGVALL